MNYDVNKERCLLGAILIDSTLLPLLKTLRETDFYVPETRDMARKMLMLDKQGKPVDLLLLASAYEPVDVNRAMAYMRDLMHEGKTWHAKQYAKDIRELGRRRELVQLLTHSLERLSGDDATEIVTDELRTGLRELTTVSGGVTRMRDVTGALYDHLERKVSGEDDAIKTGLCDLDAVIGGLYRRELTIIGARPGVGKSAFAQSIALSAARQGKRVLIISREMSDVQYAQRMVSDAGDINGKKLRTAKLSENEWTDFGSAINELGALGVSFTFSTRYVEDVRGIVQSELDGGGLDLVIVDYIQLMQTRERTESEVLRLGRISGALKSIALELNLPVLALAQVRRMEGRAAIMPTLQDLKGSGDLEQDADGVIFLHRPESKTDKYVQRPDMYDALQRIGSQLIAINVAKQRQGETGHINVAFDPTRMRYTCLARDKS